MYKFNDDKQCLDCSRIFTKLEMKDGYCKDCYPDHNKNKNKSKKNYTYLKRI